METERERSSETAAFSKPVVLGASGLTTPRMGIVIAGGGETGSFCDGEGF